LPRRFSLILTATAVLFSQQVGTCVGHPPAGNGRPDRANGPSRADEERAPRGRVSQAIVPDAIALGVIAQQRPVPGARRGPDAKRRTPWDRTSCHLPGTAPFHSVRSAFPPPHHRMKQLHNVR